MGTTRRCSAQRFACKVVQASFCAATCAQVPDASVPASHHAFPRLCLPVPPLCSFEEFVRMAQDKIFMTGKLQEYKDAFRWGGAGLAMWLGGCHCGTMPHAGVAVGSGHVGSLPFPPSLQAVAFLAGLPAHAPTCPPTGLQGCRLWRQWHHLRHRALSALPAPGSASQVPARLMLHGMAWHARVCLPRASPARSAVAAAPPPAPGGGAVSHYTHLAPTCA